MSVNVNVNVNKISSGPPRKRIRQIAGQSSLKFQRKEDSPAVSNVSGYHYFDQKYDVTDVPVDGNCLFACLSLGTNRGLSAEIVQEVHQEIVTFMREHPELVTVHGHYLHCFCLIIRSFVFRKV